MQKTTQPKEKQMSDKFIPIESSNLSAAKYENGTLSVKFRNGGHYEYSDVSPELYEKFAQTFDTKESSGKFLHTHIRPLKYKKIS